MCRQSQAHIQHLRATKRLNDCGMILVCLLVYRRDGTRKKMLQGFRFVPIYKRLGKLYYQRGAKKWICSFCDKEDMFNINEVNDICRTRWEKLAAPLHCVGFVSKCKAKGQ